MKVFISTSSFALDDARPIEALKEAGLDICLNPHKRKLSEDEMIRFLSDADFLIAGTEPITRQVIDSAKRLKVISRCGAGLDNVDLKAADEAGIKVYNTPYGPTLSVAELTVGLCLSLLRMVPTMDRDVRSGVWKKRMGSLLSGKKAGIVGFGRIGQKVAGILISLGLEAAYYDVDGNKPRSNCAFKPLNELLAWADIISLHCSAPACSCPVIGKEELKLMRKGAWLINTARGELVDEGALYAMLKEGHLSGAALDVFRNEPYTGPLSGLDNVILTPHIGSYAKEARIKMETDAVENLLSGLRRGRKEKRK